MIDKKALFPVLKDRGIFLGWLGAIFLIAALCWFLTGSFRGELLRRAINRADFPSIRVEDRPFLEKYIPKSELLGSASRMGFWYSLRGNDESKALVFSFFGQGSFFPCMALVNPEGKVEKIVPLNIHAESMIGNMPQGALRLHIRRIEGGEL